MKLTKEQISRAMECRSVEELLELAKASGIDLTKEEAETYYAQLSGRELDPNDIGDIAGGCIGNSCNGNISAVC